MAENGLLKTTFHTMVQRFVGTGAMGRVVETNYSESLPRGKIRRCQILAAGTSPEQVLVGWTFRARWTERALFGEPLSGGTTIGGSWNARLLDICV